MKSQPPPLDDQIYFLSDPHHKHSLFSLGGGSEQTEELTYLGSCMHGPQVTCVLTPCPRETM